MLLAKTASWQQQVVFLTTAAAQQGLTGLTAEKKLGQKEQVRV